MREIYNGETVALGGSNLVTKQVVVDDSTGEKGKFTYDKTTGAVTVLDEVDPDSVNPVTSRAVATAVASASGEVPVIGDDDDGKVLTAVVSGGQKKVEWGKAASGGLPESTAADEGKVLTVDAQGDPEWAASPAPTVSDIVAKFRYGVATYAEVVAAFNAGKSIYLYLGDTEGGCVATDIFFTLNGEIEFTRHFTPTQYDDPIEFKNIYTLNSSNSWSFRSVKIPVDQIYKPLSVKPQSGTAVAQAIQLINAVPHSTVLEKGNVLTVNATGRPHWANPPSNIITLAGTEDYADIIGYLQNGYIVQYFSSDGNPLVYNQYTLAQYDPTSHVVRLSGIYKQNDGTGSFCLGTWTISGSTWTKDERTIQLSEP